jgi:hypothetical protein
LIGPVAGPPGSLRALGVYVLWVRNVGTAATSAPTVVIDAIPAGLVPRNAGGGGFDCAIAGRRVTCTRNSSIAPGSTAPIILLVGTTAPAGTSITNTAIVTPLDATPSDNTSSVTAQVR